mgnify:CR=1 FL=1|jgi:hypothetical protein
MEGSAERLHNEVGASRPHESPLGTSADRASPQLREGAEHVSVSAGGHRWPSAVIRRSLGGHQGLQWQSWARRGALTCEARRTPSMYVTAAMVIVSHSVATLAAYALVEE